MRLDRNRRTESRTRIQWCTDDDADLSWDIDNWPMSRFTHLAFIATGCIGEIQIHSPVIVLPLIHGHAVRLWLRCAGRGENQIPWSELLDDVDCVGVAITRHHVLRCIEDFEDDVACRADANVHPQFQYVVCAFVQTLHGFTHRPSFEIQRKRTRILGRWYRNLKVLGYRLSRVQTDHQREVDLPTPW